MLNMHNKKKLVVIVGPTAVGKTATSIDIAQHFGTEIISADSRQCYREMSIGTAKPDAAELAAVHHYFINSHSIIEELNAGDYEQLALSYCDAIFSKNDYAVVCGGTGLYIKAFCEGIDEMPKTDRTIEKTLQDAYNENGIEWLQNIVAKEDPEFYVAAEQQNPARLIRALAFKRSNGSSIVHFRSGNQKERYFDIIKIGLDLPREILYERINRRVDIMMEQGLWEEAAGLYPQRLLKNMQTVGYTEIFECLDGTITKEKSIELIKQHSRNYAKRQLTWFRKDKDFQWFEPNNLQGILSAVERS
jgi:tRNA dimethylallyltransferase